MNLFVSTTFLADNKSLKEALTICNENDINGLELGSNHCHENNYDYCLDFDFRYLVHNYFPIPEKSFVINIASNNDEIVNRSITQIKKSIDFCQKIGAELYTFHPGFLTDPMGSNKNKKNYDFQWDEKQLKDNNYNIALERMYKSIDIILEYAIIKNTNISIETEGSVSKKNHLLMQTPIEYQKFIQHYSSSDIGINLNIGHLNLAANSFSFDRMEFVEIIADYVVAMELSHNEGVEDDHLPLKEVGWYWDLIFDERFIDKPKILEFRNTDISAICENIKLIKNFSKNV